MLRLVLDGHDGSLPPNVRAVYCNTGKEREETLCFIDEMSRRWGIHIDWIEYFRDDNAGGGMRDPKNTFREIDYATAARDGQPFRDLIRFKKALPSWAMRFCTVELKVRTCERWARRRLGWHRRRAPIDHIGIRADESARFKRLVFGTAKCRVRTPLVERGIDEPQVIEWWRQQPFDLALEPGKSLSNCDLCFLKGRRSITRLITEEPERAAWWIEQEAWRRANRSTARTEKILRFVDEATYSEMAADAHAGQTPEPTDNARTAACFCGD